MTRVVLHIDRLVLRGVERHDAEAVATALHGALQRWLAQPGAAAALTGRDGQAVLRVRSMPLPAGADATRLAQAVVAGIAAAPQRPLF